MRDRMSLRGVLVLLLSMHLSLGCLFVPNIYIGRNLNQHAQDTNRRTGELHFPTIPNFLKKVNDISMLDTTSTLYLINSDGDLLLSPLLVFEDVVSYAYTQSPLHGITIYASTLSGAPINDLPMLLYYCAIFRLTNVDFATLQQLVGFQKGLPEIVSASLEDVRYYFFLPHPTFLLTFHNTSALDMWFRLSPWMLSCKILLRWSILIMIRGSRM